MRFRAIEKIDPSGKHVIVQRKRGLFKPWEYYHRFHTIEEADRCVKEALVERTVVVRTWNYSRSGHRIFDTWL